MTNQEPDQLKPSTSERGNPANPRFRQPLERRSSNIPDSAREGFDRGHSPPPNSPQSRKSAAKGTRKNPPRSMPPGARKINSTQKKKRWQGFSPKLGNRFGNWLSKILGGAPRQQQRTSMGSRKSVPQNSFQNSSQNLPHNPLDTPLPRRRLSSLPPTVPQRIPSKSSKRPPSKKKGAGSTVVYGLRLLIVGVGLGAIAGTVLYISDPATRPISTTTKMSVPEANPKTPSPSDSVASSITAMKLQQEIPALQEQLGVLIKARTNFQAGVFLHDLDNGSFVDLLADNSFAAASTIKLPILVAFFQDVDAKKINLGEMLTLEKRFVATGSGELQDQPLGTKYTVLDVATRMMVGSDNTATNMIIDRLGGLEVVNQRFQGWGLKSTSLQAMLPDLEGTNLTTPKELALVMAAVEQGELISRRSRDLVFSIMQRTENNTLLPQGLEKNATIAHKTGNLGTLVADAGLIDMPNGKRYILVVMVKRPRNDQQGAELVRQISRTTYNYFKQAPTSGKP